MGCDSPGDSVSTAGSSASLPEWCPHNVRVRDWAPFGSRPSSKIDRNVYKKLSHDLLSQLPNCLQNQVVVRAPFAANFQLVFGIKGGGRDLCREVRDALSIGTDHQLQVRGEPLRVSVELSPRKKITLGNMFRAESFLKKQGVDSDAYTLCPKKATTS